jgi:hypothetical protein
MSARKQIRILWSIPVVVFASWLAVRALADSSASWSPAESPVSTPVAFATATEVEDPSLRQLIGRFAHAARSKNGDVP